MSEFEKDLTSIAMALIGVAMLALLVGHAAGTGYLINASTSGFNTLLNTVELSNTASNGPSSGGGLGSMFGAGIGGIGASATAFGG